MNSDGLANRLHRLPVLPALPGGREYPQLLQHLQLSGKCLDKCPLHLAIPELLNEVREDMEGWLTNR